MLVLIIIMLNIFNAECQNKSNMRSAITLIVAMLNIIMVNVMAPEKTSIIILASPII
jgi:hypothetical protein